MRQALADLSTSLNHIRALADKIVADTGAALADPAVRELHETQQCAAIVLLTGYFEAFLKDLVRRFIEDLSNSGVPFSMLPEEIRNCHFEGGGSVLAEASKAGRKGKPTSFGNASREDIVARLHSTSAGVGSYQILWEAFADTEANPGPDVVKSIGKNLGLANFWPTVSINTGDQARWSDTALTSQLSDLITKRNECAHTGKVAPIPSASEVFGFADMLEALGTGFTSALEDALLRYGASSIGSWITQAGTTAAVPSLAGTAAPGKP